MVTKMPDTNGWGEWSRHVLRELERLDSQTEQFREDQESFRKEVREKLEEQGTRITILQVKSGLLGFVAGLVGTLIPVIIALLMGALK
jgi:hypothetical protein